MYAKYKSDGFIDNRTITMQLNVDGAQIFNSSKFSFMPCMGVINEAPYKIRRSNILLLGLWYGNHKPSPAHFLNEVVKTLQHLSANGFEVDGERWRVQLTVITVDTIARPMLRCTTQFNGEYGCDFCLLPGKTEKVKINFRSHKFKIIFMQESLRKKVKAIHVRIAFHVRWNRWLHYGAVNNMQGIFK